jgi:hypothetical protein
MAADSALLINDSKETRQRLGIETLENAKRMAAQEGQLDPWSLPTDLFGNGLALETNGNQCAARSLRTLASFGPEPIAEQRSVDPL